MMTVQEVADILGIAVQSVYRKINKQLPDELAPYIKEVKRGKRTVKMVEPQGLAILQESMVEPVQGDVNTGHEPVNTELIDVLKRTISSLEEQLSVKDEQLARQIDELTQQLDVKDKQLAAKDEQINNITEALQNQQKIEHTRQLAERDKIDQMILPESVELTSAWGKFTSIFRKQK